MSQEKSDGEGQLQNERSVRRPFDTRDLANVPQPDDRDPPYLSWWVGAGSEADNDNSSNDNSSR